jgi:ring-1,2-phenylacetyl-CoA epoxidase subunit PaaC
VTPGTSTCAPAAAATEAGSPCTEARFRYVLRLADTSLVLGQRLGEWVGHAPALEEDLALANIALDLIGQARLLLSHAGEIEGQGRDEDALAFLREAPEFCNVSLAEQPNGDFGGTIVRQFLIDAWQVELYEALSRSSDARLAEIAAKAVKETRYHLRFSAGWLVRLGDGTAESHARVEQALEALWRFTEELLTPDALDEEMAAAGIGPSLTALRPRWEERVAAVLQEATLAPPAPARHPWYGKRGVHTEHLGHMLAQMQHLPRAFPGVTW